MLLYQCGYSYKHNNTVSTIEAEQHVKQESKRDELPLGTSACERKRSENLGK